MVLTGKHERNKLPHSTLKKRFEEIKETCAAAMMSSDRDKQSQDRKTGGEAETNSYHWTAGNLEKLLHF